MLRNLINCFFAFLVSGSAHADTQFLSFAPTYLPSYAGFGVGSYNQYLGSDESSLGFAPFGRYSFGEQKYVALQANYVTVNLLEDVNWRVGPAGVYRFGRSDVDDPVIDLLPEVDGSLDLGAFVSYEYAHSDPRNRWGIGAAFLHGVEGANDGYTVSINARRWLPVGEFSLLGLFGGITYGSSGYMDTYFSVTPEGANMSGLPVFEAGSGVRDLRLGAVFIQPLSREWQVGAGVLYYRLYEDAADSPIVSTQGDRNQIAYGFGVNRAF
ncbi:MAG: MipA/OmpV family protein [Pseudomonadota bacterium]